MKEPSAGHHTCPWDKSKVKILHGRTLTTMKLIAPALAEIKPVYYPGEEKLVSLDVLKLYRGEDLVHQNPQDVEPEQ